MYGKLDKGFTLIELIIVISILLIILIIAVPRYLNTVEISRERVCETNRNEIINIVNINMALDSDNSFKEFLADNYSSDTPQLINPLIEKLEQIENSDICPSNGDITAQYIEKSNGNYSLMLFCSKHSNDNEDTDDNEDAGDSAVVPIDRINIDDWPEVLNYAANNYGKNLSQGEVFQDETGTYIVIYGSYIGGDDGKNNINLQEFAAKSENVVKLDLNADPLTSEDTKILENKIVWKPERLPQKGTIAKVGDDYYVCTINSSSEWTVETNIETSDLWINISK